MRDFEHRKKKKSVMWGQSEKTVISKLGREALGETKSADIWILNFEFGKLWEVIFVCLFVLKHPICDILIP